MNHVPESPEPGRFPDEEAGGRPDPRGQADGTPGVEPQATESPEEVDRDRRPFRPSSPQVSETT
jgi:hypothetical protein